MENGKRFPIWKTAQNCALRVGNIGRFHSSVESSVRKKEGSTASRVLPVAGCPFIGATRWPRRLAVSRLIYAFRCAGSRPAGLPGGLSGRFWSCRKPPASTNGPLRDLREGAAALRRGLGGVAASGVWFYVFEIRRCLRIRSCPSWTQRVCVGHKRKSATGDGFEIGKRLPIWMCPSWTHPT